MTVILLARIIICPSRGYGDQETLGKVNQSHVV